MNKERLITSAFVIFGAMCLIGILLTPKPNLGTSARLTIPFNRTLVIFLNKYPQTSWDVSGAKTWLNNDLYSHIARLSFNTELLSITYAGPYVGDIENCDNGSLGAITTYGVNRAYRAGIDVSQFNYFIVLRNSDFQDDYGCWNAGQGAYALSPWSYEGGVLTGVGVSTIAAALTPFALPTSSQPAHRTVHEFLHGYGGGTSHTVNLECSSDPSGPSSTRVPYYYAADESVLASSYCRRQADSLIDVMGGPRGPSYLEINSILKKQYRWLPGGNIATVTGAELRAGRTFTLRPIETAASPGETQMVVVPIAGTTKAYVLEMRGGPAVSGTGVYLYLMPFMKSLAYNEQYLLYTGEVFPYGTPPSIDDRPAPMRLGQTMIDSKMHLAVTITSVSSTGALLRVFTTP